MLVTIHLVPLDGDHLAEHLCRECLLGLAAKVLRRLGAVNVLEAYLVLLVALIEHRDGVAVRHSHHLARELKGLGGEGEKERE